MFSDLISPCATWREYRNKWVVSHFSMWITSPNANLPGPNVFHGSNQLKSNPFFLYETQEGPRARYVMSAQLPPGANWALAWSYHKDYSPTTDERHTRLYPCLGKIGRSARWEYRSRILAQLCTSEIAWHKIIVETNAPLRRLWYDLRLREGSCLMKILMTSGPLRWRPLTVLRNRDCPKLTGQTVNDLELIDIYFWIPLLVHYIRSQLRDVAIKCTAHASCGTR